MSSNLDQELVCGLNAVNQIIISRPKSVKSLYFSKTTNSRIKSVIKEAEKNKIKVSKKDPGFFEKEFKDINHQSIAVECNKRLEESEAFIQSIIKKPNLTFLILDGLSDPHNVGACLRSAAAADVDAVIVPKNRSCRLTPSVRKISCGASELIPFVIVTNIVRTINNLQEMGVLVYGSDLKASLGHNEIDYPNKVALVIGSEDKGIRRLTRENCDHLVKIKMSEKTDSLNASVSAGIMLFKIKEKNNSFN